MKIRCSTCKYYYITHDYKRPWGCKKFGFKSNILPNYEVKNTTGMECAYFVLKNQRKVHREK